MSVQSTICSKKNKLNLNNERKKCSVSTLRTIYLQNPMCVNAFACMMHLEKWAERLSSHSMPKPIALFRAS